MSMILGPTGYRVVNYEPEARGNTWDSIQVRVAGRTDTEAMRNRYPEGKRYGQGLGFYIDSARCAPDGPGMSIADVTLKGLWRIKRWGTPVFRVRTDSPSNVKIVPVSASTFWTKTNILVAEPGFVVYSLDNQAPSQTGIGKPAATGFGGITLPTMTQSANPYTFTGVPTSDVTLNYPFGWVFEGCEVQDTVGGSLWFKAYHYVWRFQYGP